MGFAGSWLSVRCDLDTALAQLGFEPGARLGKDQIPRKLGVGSLPDGWIVFFSEDFDLAFHPKMVALSRLGPAVGCAVEEHVMVVEARGFADGVESWRIRHDPEISLRHLEATGALPPEYPTIRATYFAQQDAEDDADAEVDCIFEVPLEVAAAVCPFRHDKAWAPDFVFTELKRAGSKDPPPKRPGFFARLLGQR